MTSFSKDTKDYFKSKQTVSKWWNPTEGTYRFHYEKELQVLDEKFKVNPEWKVLDVCTGKGRFAIYFAKKGCRVTAVDINEEMLNIAKENAKKEGVSDNIIFLLGDAEDLSDLDSDYDVVCCMEALDHLPNIEKANKAMTGKIKPSGFFLYTFVPDSSIYWKMFTSMAHGDSVARAHSYNYILDILKRNNIKTENSFGVGIIFPLGPLIMRIPLHVLARIEKIIKPYYTDPAFVKYCTHIIGWGVKSNGNR